LTDSGLHSTLACGFGGELTAVQRFFELTPRPPSEIRPWIVTLSSLNRRLHGRPLRPVTRLSRHNELFRARLEENAIGSAEAAARVVAADVQPPLVGDELPLARSSGSAAPLDRKTRIFVLMRLRRCSTRWINAPMRPRSVLFGREPQALAVRPPPRPTSSAIDASLRQKP